MLRQTVYNNQSFMTFFVYTGNEMKYFFSINKIFPNVCIELKFGLNHIFDSIQDNHTHFRILNAIYILSIDLKADNIFEPGTVINDFIKLIRKLLELEKYEDNDDLDSNICAVETFLDVFFLLKFPNNCQLIEITNLKVGELRLHNFWILGQLTSELYQNSRESSCKFNKSFLNENRHAENKIILQKETGIECSTLNVKIDEVVEDFETISQIFEYKNCIKIGIPSHLDFEYNLGNNKRINFFYLDEYELDIVNKIVSFSFSLKNQILLSLFKILKRFQNKYQYNPVSILIYRLIIYRYFEFGNDTINTLNQLIENSKSEILINSLFECSLLIKDDELYSIFDFYNQLENSCDFTDIVTTINNLIRVYLENYSTSISKFSSWMKTEKNDQILNLDRKINKINFSNTFEVVKWYLDRLKNEFCLISKKFENLVLKVKENESYCCDQAEPVLNEIKILLFSTPIFNRSDLLEILCILFSINLDGYLNSTLQINCDDKCDRTVKTNYFSKNKQSVIFTLFNTESSRANYFSKSELCYIKFETVKLIKEIQNCNLQKELLFVLQNMSAKHQSILLWYISSNTISLACEFVSKLFAERRRLGALQCYLNCMELEFKNIVTNNLEIQ